MARILVAISHLLLVLLCACRYEPPASHTATVVVRQPEGGEAVSPAFGRFAELPTPAAAGAGEPFVDADTRGGLLLTWIEPVAEGNALKLARFSNGAWSTPSTVVARGDLFVNLADFPSVAASGDTLFAHWLQKRKGSKYGYDIHLAISRDDGSSWPRQFLLNDDGTATEHGFVSMVGEAPDNSVSVAWLDGRNTDGEDEGHGGPMTLRYARVGADGTVSGGTELDARTCDCCQTTMVATPEGPVIAYRDRSESEIRDISLIRRRGGAWTSGTVVHDDGWKIDGCPVNGPQMDARGARVVIAWYTEGRGKREVNVAFSDDAGATFSMPVVVAERETIGEVDVVFIKDDRALVSWIDDDGANARVSVREMTRSGPTGKASTVATITRGRTGFPRLALAGGYVYIAWASKGDAPRIHLARAKVGD